MGDNLTVDRWKTERCYSLRLEECGQGCVVNVEDDNYTYQVKVEIPYSVMSKQFAWEYIEGKGLVTEIPGGKMDQFWERVDELKNSLPNTDHFDEEGSREP